MGTKPNQVWKMTQTEMPGMEKKVPKPKTRAQLGRRSKMKGKEFERLVVRKLAEAGIPSERGWWQSMGGGTVPDVMVEGLWIECGHGKVMEPRVKLEQAEGYVATCKLPVVPVAITRRNREDIKVTMRVGGLLTLLDGHVMGILAAKLMVTMPWEHFVGVLLDRRTEAKESASFEDV